jgi:hypothetical protein
VVPIWPSGTQRFAMGCVPAMIWHESHWNNTTCPVSHQTHANRSSIPANSLLMAWSGRQAPVHNCCMTSLNAR